MRYRIALVLLCGTALAFGPSFTLEPPETAGPVFGPGAVSVLQEQPSTEILNETDYEAGVPRTTHGGTDAVIYALEWIVNLDSSVYCVGVTQVQDSLMWVSAGRSQLKIYIYNIANPLHPCVGSFAQTGGPSGWGIRDMEYYPTEDVVFAGFDGNRFHRYNATTHAVLNTYTVSGGPGTCRNMGIWPDDSLMTGNWSPNRAMKMSRTGTNCHTIGSISISPYGCTYDANQDCWWYTDGSYGPIHKMAHPGLAELDNFKPSGWNTGGGASMWMDDTFLLALNQASPDMVYCLRFRFPPNDVGITDIERPTFFGEFPLPFTPKAEVTNIGSATQSNFDVKVEIYDNMSNLLHADTVTIPGPLNGGATTWAVFPAWSTSQGVGYDAVFTTMLVGDQQPANDEMSRTFLVDDTLECYWDAINPASPTNGWAWYVGGNSWLHAYPNHWGGVKICRTKIALYPTGSANSYSVQIVDNTGTSGAPGAELWDSGTQTGTLGTWITDDIVPPLLYGSDRFYVQYKQVYNYPNTPYLSIDGSKDSPSWGQWECYNGNYAARNMGGDFGIRCFVTMPQHDVGVSAILSPASSKVEAGVTLTPEIAVTNFGLSAEPDFPVYFTVDSAGTEIYNQVQLISLAVGQTDTLTFSPDWTLGPLWSGYIVNAYTVLIGDEIPGDDTCSLNCLATVDTIFSNGLTGTAPTIDGYMAPGEWDEAYAMNASNIFGWMSAPQDPYEAFAYFMHDAGKMYMAFAMPYALTRDVNDQIGFYCDENNNGQWEYDYSEGNHWFVFNGTNDTVLYRYWTPSGPNPVPQPALSCQSASGISNGYLVFETTVPFGTHPEKLTLNPSGGDTCGIYFYELDSSEFYGWWRSGMNDAQFQYPQFYGKLILKSLEHCDIAVTEIIQPVGVVDTNTVVTPTAKWRNNSAATGNFTAYFKLYDPTDALYYSEEISVLGLAAGWDTILVFPDSNIGTTEGGWTAYCSTYAGNDTFPGNDVMSQGFIVSAGSPDVGVTDILAPTGFIDTIAPVTPKATVKNFGDVTMTFDAWFMISDTSTDVEVYRQSATVTNLDPAVEREVVFPDWTVTSPRVRGRHTTLCSLAVSDLNSANNTMSGSFLVGITWPAGWHEVKPMPIQPSGKPVKRGGWLAFNEGDGLVYAAKGYKTTDFYRYDPIGDSWHGLTGMPYQTHTNPKWARKVPRKGSKGVCDGDHYIYVTQGNNTLGFWKYFVDGDSWKELSDVPFGPYRKKVKGGTDLAYVPGEGDDDDYVYLLKGYKTEFYRYNVATSKWDTLPEAPIGVRKKWDKGSWLVFNEADGTDDAKLLYAHKAKYYTGTDHEMWKYNIAGDSWSDKKLKGMPLWGLHSGRRKKKKSKDGGSGAWYESEIYALKGGNTQQFFKYTAAKDSWTELDTVPNYTVTTGRKRRVKYGADIVSHGSGAFFALKGNKTVEMWRYVIHYAFSSRPERSGVMTGGQRLAVCGLLIAPNPLASGLATLRYTLPNAGPAQVSIFDVAGRVVQQRTVLASRSGAISLDLRNLSAGVYLLRFNTNDFSTTHKLVVQH